MRVSVFRGALIWFAGTIALASPAFAESCKLTASDVYSKASASVVRIFNMAIDPFEPQEKVRFSVGTGFVIDKDSSILTNYHVLLDSTRINLSFADGSSAAGQFIAGDPILDIAIVRPEIAMDEIIPLELGADQAPEVGTDVFAIGHPLGLKMAVSRGIISSTDVVLPITTMSWDAPFIQTDAAINPGNSGGPLVDSCGKVVGMNTLGARQAENMGFAIPAVTLRKAIPQLLQSGHIVRPWIGISGQMADQFISSLANTSFTFGFVIETVEPGSAADQAGLRGGTYPLRLGPSNYLLGGDIITSVNGRELTDLGTTAAIVRSLKAGDTIDVEYFREGQITKLQAKLPERPSLPGDIRVLYRTVYNLP